MPSRQMPTPAPASVPSAVGQRDAISVSRLVVGLGIGGGGAASLVLVVVAVVVVFKCVAGEGSGGSGHEGGSVKQVRRYSYKQLKAATGSFSPSNRLGQGGFGTVYRGALGSGQAVAVKKLEASSMQGEREFQNEVSLIGSLHSPHIVSLLGFCVHGKRRLLVYDFMANRSLQEALFDDDYPVSLAWDTRFNIILDTAHGLAFLHFHCNPPIIHGDVKPSNILLDANFSARIADFGLARVKLEEPPAPDSDSAMAELEREALERERIRFERAARDKARRQRRREEAERKKKLAAAAASSQEEQGQEQQEQGDMPATAPAPAAAAAATTPVSELDKTPAPESSPLDDGRTEGDTETVDLSVEDGGRGEHSKSEGVPSSGELSIRDYILEWRTNESARRARASGRGSSWRDDSSFEFNSKERRRERSRSSDGWVEISGELLQEPLKKKEVGRREGREWWKDEPVAQPGSSSSSKSKVKEKVGGRKQKREWWKEEASQQQNQHQNLGAGHKKGRAREWWNREDFQPAYSGKHRELRDVKLKERRSDKKGRSKDVLWPEDFSGELSQSAEAGAGSRRERERSRSRDWFSGEIASRGVSSTPSMRGTICYVAPEYGGGGLLSEKSDVYSFGVLMLVIISGRRPLQVMASPIAELERANLISWARHLAQAGNVLDLVDSSFQGQFSKEQATLCIMVALLCLQRIPALRPTMTDVVKILLGQAELPALPFEFSPSPPGIPALQVAFTSRSSEAIESDLPLLP